MIDKAIHNISIVCVNKLQGDERYSELKYAKITYAIEMLISEISKILIIALIFILLGRGCEYIFCFMVLILTRSFMGGIHANTYLGCLIMSLSFFGLGIVIKENVSLDSTIILILFIFFVIGVAVIAPIQSKNRFKLDKRSRYNRKILTIIFSVSLYLVVSNLCNQYLILLMYVYWFQLIGAIYIKLILKFKEVQNYEKSDRGNQ